MGIQLKLDEGSEPKTEQAAEIKSEVMTIVTEGGVSTLKFEEGVTENE